MGNDQPTQDYINTYDNDVINNPDWVTINQAGDLLQIGDRQVRNKCNDEHWQKKMAKVNGRPVAYINKQEILNYLRTKHGSPSQVNEHDKPHPNASEAALVDTESPQRGAGGLAVHNKENWHGLNEFLKMHTDLQDKYTHVESINIVNERKVTYWKTSMIWLCFMATALIGGSIFLWFDANGRAQMILKNNQSLTESLVSTQDKLNQSSKTLLEKESKIHEMEARLKDTETKKLDKVTVGDKSKE